MRDDFKPGSLSNINWDYIQAPRQSNLPHGYFNRRWVDSGDITVAVVVIVFGLLMIVLGR